MLPANDQQKMSGSKMFELQEQLDRMSQELATAINQANELNSRQTANLFISNYFYYFIGMQNWKQNFPRQGRK